MWFINHRHPLMFDIRFCSGDSTELLSDIETTLLTIWNDSKLGNPNIMPVCLVLKVGPQMHFLSTQLYARKTNIEGLSQVNSKRQKSYLVTFTIKFCMLSSILYTTSPVG